MCIWTKTKGNLNLTYTVWGKPVAQFCLKGAGYCKAVWILASVARTGSGDRHAGVVEITLQEDPEAGLVVD